MNNGIIDRENSDENLFKLAAQNHLYSKAKSMLGLEVIAQVVLVVILALLPIFITDSFLMTQNIKKEHFTIATVSCSIILTIADLIIMVPLINKERELAASIQEDYDCTVLSIPWNDIKVDKPDGEIISCNANEYIKSVSNKSESVDVNYRNALDSFKNWYSPEEIKILPLEVGRIICQRTNCWWDSYLRNKFRRDIVICSSIIFFILLIITVLRDMSATNVIINVVSPFIPVLSFAIIQYRENTKSIKCTEKLKLKSDEYWESVISNANNLNVLDDLARKLQNEIFDSRKSSPLIFNWYYNRYKKNQQRDTDFKAETMIHQYKSSRQSNP